MEEPNRIYLEQLSDGDASFENQIISIIKKEFPVEVLEYQNSIKSNDFLKTADNVHKLKHKISILGLEKGYALASEYEKELKQGMKIQQISFEKILNQISLYLNTI
jgi:HPt (histidine-containing phosphotransfer) domain-containing protein